jgi:hypothetical protein
MHYEELHKYHGSDQGAGVAQSVLKVGFGLDDRSTSPGRGNGGNFFSSPPRPNRLWGPPSLLSNGYRGLLPRG